MCRDGSCNVDEVHQASAKKIPQRIGVVGKHDLGHLRL